MGLLSRFFLKRAEREYNQRSIDDLNKDSAECLRRTAGSNPCFDLSNIYSSQMDGNAGQSSRRASCKFPYRRGHR